MSDLPVEVATLDPEILKHIQSYDEYLQFYISLDQQTTAYSWLKADLLYSMAQNLGETSLVKLAGDTQQPRSTIINYIRAARAFPPEKREIGASFSLHFQASYADSFDTKTKDFDGVNRFKALEEAMDNNMSTRRLADHIQDNKREQEVEDMPAEDPRKDVLLLVKEIRNDLDFFYGYVLSDNKAYEIIEATQKWLRKEKKKFQSRASDI